MKLSRAINDWHRSRTNSDWIDPLSPAHANGSLAARKACSFLSDRSRDHHSTNQGFVANSGIGTAELGIDRRGAVFRIERRRGEFLAKWLSPVAIFLCEGMRDPESETALVATFAKGGWLDVTRLYRGDNAPEENCWLRAPGWSLATR